MREKEPSTAIIFVRHGNTDFPKDRLYCDDVEDPSLNEEGVKQANLAADMLQDVHVDAIISSPSKRTLMTADPIANSTKLRIETDAALKERPFGIWDGLYFDAIEQEFPEDYLSWKKNPISFVPQGGESILDLAVRVKNVLEDVIRQYHGKTVVIVSHVGPIRVMISQAMDIPLEKYRQLTINNGSISRIDYGRRQNNVIYLNRCHE